MQLVVEHDLQTELVLPINYQHIMQGIIYNSLHSIAGYGDFLHNNGYEFGERQYRLFTFSRLYGRYRIEKEHIIFKDHVSFEVRSTDNILLRILQENILQNGIQYRNQKYYGVTAVIKDETIEEEEIRIRMLTPIVAYETDALTKKTNFFIPDQEEFYYSVQDNFIRKYSAYADCEVREEIEFFPLKVTDKDKCVTKYKGIYMTGWLGEYLLKGKRKYLDFLFQVGIGSKNAQGFGMFQVIEN